MVLIKKNTSNEKNLELDNLVVNESFSGTFSISPSNIQTNPPNVLTVNEISKLIGTQGALVDTNTIDQVIQSSKIFNSGVKADIANGYFAIRIDSTPGSFIHNISYDINTASIFLNSVDTNVVSTGVLIGCKTANIKSNPTVNKFQFGHLGSQANSSFINIENVEFMRMNSVVNSRFALSNIDQISIGSNLLNQAAIYVEKTGVPVDIYVNSIGGTASLTLAGTNSIIYVGQVFSIVANSTIPSLLKVFRSPTISIMDFNSASGCVSVGDNNESSGLNYAVFNAGVPDKILKIPYMTTTQQNNFLITLVGTAYRGSLFFNTTTNRLCFTDTNNALHQVSGTTSISGNNLSLIVESTITPAKTGTILVDDNQLAQNNNVFMPLNTNVELKYLEGMTGANIQNQIDGKISATSTDTLLNKTISGASNTITDISNSSLSTGIDALKISGGLITNTEFDSLDNITGNIQTQLDNKVTLNTVQTITENKTFESALANNNNIAIKNTVQNNCSLSFENAFSVNKTRIRKVNDDISFEISNTERAKISGDNLDLVNGGSYLKNGVNINAEVATLTNKTIQFGGTNTLTNVCSTTTTQTVSGLKTFSNAQVIFSNATETNLRYTGGTPNISTRMSNAGFRWVDDTAVVNLMTLSNTNGLDIVAAGKLKVNNQTVHKLRNSTGSDPLVTSDTAAGYEEGSTWFNTVTKSRWICDESANGAANWRNTNRKALTFSPFTTVNLLSLESFLYFTCDYNYYSSFTVIAFCSSTCNFQLYNLSTASIVATSATFSGGPNKIITTFAITRQPEDYTFRLSVTLLTAGTVTVYSAYTD